MRNLWFRIVATFAPGRMERDLDEEMAFHLEMEARKLMREGLSPKEAVRRARKRFGEPLREKERARSAWGISVVQNVRSDARQTFRSLRRNPVFTVVAILTLGLGIGGTTAIFSVVNGVLLKPLPYSEPQELVSVLHTWRIDSSEMYPLDPAFYLTFRDHAHTLQDIGLYSDISVTVTGLDRPERLEALQITDGLLPLLGIQPILGRSFRSDEVVPGPARPLLLSYGYWQRRFGGDPDILGRGLRVDGEEREVVGVLPRDARLSRFEPEIILPLVFDRARTSVGNFSYNAVARLSHGATVETATRELASMTEQAEEEYPGGLPLSELRARDFSSLVRPLKAAVVGGADRALWVVFATVCMVLLIACANVANLFLVRAEGRQRDTALRAALGASRIRLAAQFLTESLTVGFLGGFLGVLLATAGIRALLVLAPSSLPRMEEVGLDPVVLAFAVGVSALTGFLFGSIPVLSLTRGNLSSPIKAGGRGAGGSKKRFRVRTLFAVIQVGMVLVLSVASGLMVRTFQELNAVQPGFEDPEEVLTFRLATPASEIPDIDEAVHTLQAVLERIQALPGVTSASGAASVAMEGWESWDNWMVEEFPLPRGGTSPSRRINWMIPGYHETIQDRLLAGRSIEWADIYERRNVALVTESFAREYWGEPGAALGKRIRNSDSSPWREIVGVVGNVYTRGVASDPPLVIYLPFITADFWGESSFSFRDLRYVVRTDRPDPLTLLPAVRDATWSVNRNLAIADVITLDRIYGKSIARTSFSLVMLGIAAGVAMILGMVGVYGVVSFIVSQRTREMGIRMALGANRAQVKGMVLKQGGTIALVGTGLGLMSAAFLTGIMASLLYGVSPLDPLTYAVVSGVLSAVVLMASYIPARRASRVDPTDALRWE